MNGLRLIADDLTGALDSGCAFATPEAAVEIAVPGRALPKSARIAISTESRDMSETDAAAAVSRAVRDLSVADPETLWFKKIDSVMRGHPFAETVAALEAGEFARCIFAPAYPGMGRITVKMQQYLTSQMSPPQPVGPDFRDAFQSITHGWRIAPPDGRTPDSKASGVITIIEADSQPLLRKRVQSAFSAVPGKMLWVGTGGLAAALTPERAPARFPPVRGVIVGTNHVSTRQQVAAALSDAVLTEITNTMSIDRGTEEPWLFAPGVRASDAAGTDAALRLLLPDIRFENPISTSLVVTGGDTLSIVLDVTGAEYLECYGEAATGVPASRIHGGRWHGVTLLSKSGGFGDAALLCRLAAGAWR